MTGARRGRTAAAAIGLGLGLAIGAAGAGEVRIITGPGVPVLPRPERPPERIEPPPRPVKPAAPIVERRQVMAVEDTATLTHERLRVRLAGVAAVARDETCRDAAGVEWPCGRRMLAGMRAFVRLRPVACPLPSDARAGDHRARCAIGDVDLGERAVRAGWARAEAGGGLEAAEAEARREGRGLWGPAPVAATGEPTVPADLGRAAATGDGVPPDLTLAPLGGAGAPGPTPLGGAAGDPPR